MERRSDVGYVYLLRYDNGVVKGGRTSNPDQRLRTLTTNGGRLNLRVTHTWTSAELSCVKRTERRLLGVLRSLGRRALGGREYFVEAPFTVAKARMENLLRAGRHGDYCGCRHCECQDVFPISATVAEVSQTLGWRGDFLNVDVTLKLPCGGTLDTGISDCDVMEGRLVLNPGDAVDLEIERLGTSWTAWAVTSGGAYAQTAALIERSAWR
ncbi:GIY-YIG nuclease family protein [Micromonospora sp. KC207]|uniref:GIY-YIG nuclease family protein n=1 Tax=Micromonospora sp. KC207 TaxID=2530377 RepID=UPI001404B30B|nr:GIY-YIG nuclease family protein [Micromonospora sp. KC207]